MSDATVAVYGLAVVGSLALLWILGRCILQAADWHAKVSQNIAVLQSEQKYQEDRLQIAAERIFALNEKAKVEFKR